MKRRTFLASLVVLPLAAQAAPRPIIRIKKKERLLRFEPAIGEAREFRCALGGAPEGDKERQGDSRTPEGEHYVAWKNPNSAFHLFLGLSYPMIHHAALGRQSGLIDTATEEEIRRKVKARRQPPQHTKLGGWVGIHGGGSSADWTLGCIAVTDEEIEWIYARAEVGDKVIIEP